MNPVQNVLFTHLLGVNATGNDQNIKLYPIARPGDDFEGAAEIQYFCIVVDIDSDGHVSLFHS